MCFISNQFVSPIKGCSLSILTHFRIIGVSFILWHHLSFRTDYLLAYSCLLLLLIDEFLLSRNSPISLFELYTVQLLWNPLLGWNSARCNGLEEVPCHDSCPIARCSRGLHCWVTGHRQGCAPQGIKIGQTKKTAQHCREKCVAATLKEWKEIFYVCLCILTRWYLWINPSGTSISPD